MKGWKADVFKATLVKLRGQHRAKKAQLGEEYNMGGYELYTLEGIYLYLAHRVLAKYNCSDSTVAGWAKPGANGPGEPEIAATLERALGVSLLEQNETDKEKNKMATNYSEFVKNNIIIIQ